MCRPLSSGSNATTLTYSCNERWSSAPAHRGRSQPATQTSIHTSPIVRRKDEAIHGHYRTKSTIPQIYDAMSAAMRTGEPYQTLLDPPPADPSLAHDASTRPEWLDS